MANNIIFEPTSEDSGMLYEHPSPASSALPDWYKGMPLHVAGESITGLALDSTQATNLTVKGCMPFLDAMTSGYIFTLPFDLEIRRNERGMVGLRWATNQDLIGQHNEDQAPGMPSPIAASPSILKWKPGWKIITPAGYSCLFMHPANRFDLPFVTMSGVVDTDIYQLGVDFPFKLINQELDLLIIEKGTPICQVVPFRRENWIGSRGEFDQIRTKKQAFKLKSKIVRSYQTQFWKKKSYK